MKRTLSFVLSVVMAISVLVPGIMSLDFDSFKAEAAPGSSAYATLFTTSDLQVNYYYKQMETMISYAVDDGYSAPDAWLFGGDFQTSSNAEESITHHMDNMERLFNKFFPYYHTDNLVYIKGNHDLRDERHYETGLYEFDNFMVYVINEDDNRAGNQSDAITASENLKFALDRLLAAGNDKPVFVMTHVPFHHNSRGDYSQSAYGRYLFEVLNQYGNYMDIIFLFGHNHSGTFDDYIGGSVNYLGVGDTIYISSYDGETNLNWGETYYTPETLTFTYANYGYGGYSNNTEGTVTDTVHGVGAVKSTKIETMGVFDIYEDKITLSRYTLDGKYNEVETITRKTPTAADGSYSTPYVNVAGHTVAQTGTATGAVANAVGFGDNATYTWSSSNINIAKANGTSSVCQVSYVGEGTATITVTVSDGTHTASASYDVVVSGGTVGVQAAGSSVLMGLSNVTGKTLEYYKIKFPYSVSLIGHYTAAKSVSNEKWETSNANVATVDNGLVTFVGNGTVTITYSVDIVDANGTNKTFKSSVDFIVSNGEKQDLGEMKYVQASSIEAGKEYAIVIDYKGTKQILTEATNPVEIASSSGGYTTYAYYPKAKSISVQGSSGSFYFTGDYSDCTWKAESSSTAGAYYLKNIVSSNYFNFVGSKKVNTDGSDGGTNDYYRSAAFTQTPSSVWSLSSDYGALFDSYSIYARNGYAETVAMSDRIRTDSEKPMYFERVVTGAGTEAHIEMGGEYVEGSIKTIYRVTNDTAIRLYGDHKNYGGNVVETWSSSDEDVATIGSDGTVDFTGTSGQTTITYTVKSDNVPAKSLTVTLAAKNGREATRTFRYVENIQSDRPYIFVYKSDLTPGDGYALSTSKITKKAMLPSDIEIQQNEIHDYLYVEIPVSSSDEYVWTTNGTDPNFVFVSTEKTIEYAWWNDLNGNGEKDHDTEITYSNGYLEGAGKNAGTRSVDTTEYLGAKITDYGQWGEAGELYTLPLSEAVNQTTLTPFQFHYSGSELYNDYVANVSSSYGSYNGNTAVGYHSSHYYGIGGMGSSYSRVYAFEEVFPDPTAVILSNYEYIGKEATRDEVCPYQTEQLMAEAQNFPDGQKTYAWSSSDTTVATIDASGKITYTGKAGKTTITLTITNTSDVAENNISDTQTVEITVNPSQIVEENDENRFYLTDKFEDGKEYVLAHVNNEQSDAAKNDGLSYTISTERYNDNLAKADVNPIISGSPDYIENPTETSIWTATASGEEGYFYLTDAAGHYLAIQYDSGEYDVVRSYSSMEGATNSQGTAISADSFLIKTDGKYLYSKNTGTRGVNFNYGSSATSTKRFTVSSSASTFKLFSRTPIATDVYYKTDALTPGYEYVLAHTPDSGITYTVSNNKYEASDGNFVKADLGNVIKSGDPDFIQAPTETSVWTAVQSDVAGYVYLVDKNGYYLALDYTKPRTLCAFESIESATNVNGDPISADCFLFGYNNGYIQSKASGSGGISFNLGTTTPRFQVSSTMAKFELFSKKATEDIYYLTDTLTEGIRYVIANSNVAGSAYIASSKMYTNNTTPRLNEGVVSVSGSDVYIEAPENALVLTCVPSEKNGYYYLVDDNGKYLTLYAKRVEDADGNKVSSESIAVMADLDEYDRMYSQLRYRVSSSGIQVLQSAGGTTTASDGTTTITSGYLTFYYSGTSNPRLSVNIWTPDTGTYLYALKDAAPEEVPVPQTQIRINGSTASKDITNQIYNRYFIENGDSERLLRYVTNVKDGYSYEWSSSDTSIATIDNEGLVTYTGKEGYVTISLKVTGTDLSGAAYSNTVVTILHVFNGSFVLSEENYPEYPYEGSIRLNKTASNAVNGVNFQQTGITQIELGATGVPVDRPIDVVVVFDHSTSMNDNKKLMTAMEKTQNFALNVLQTNPNNRVAIVAFDSMGSRYSSVISTEVLNTLNETEAGIITGDGTVENAFVTTGDEASLVESIKTLSTNNQGNTNYDYGLKKAYDILKQAKEDGSPNDRIVVFMSDGEPNQFNGVQIDSSTAENDAIRKAWLTGDKQFFIDKGYLNADGSVKDEYPALALFNEDGENWYAQALKTPVDEPSNLPAFDYYASYQTGLGAKIFTIGYHTGDSFGALKNMASTPADYFNDIGGELQVAFDKIINQAFSAASNAVVTDKLGDDFDVQFAASGLTPTFEVGYWVLDNIGNRVSYNVLETITFTTNSNGVLTAATSSIFGSCYNVASGTINGQYVTYNVNTEVFTWNVGDVNRNEVTLKYYAYLEGAANHEREAGIYKTNEYATLYYTNYRGVSCSKDFPVPSLAWKQAAVSYEFYLVDDQGRPLNLYGLPVPFAERVTIGREQVKNILITGGSTTYTLNAAQELPAGYELYNPTASYTVVIPNSGSSGSATINDATKTTYFRDGSVTVNVNGAVTGVNDYQNTAVSFAVKSSQGVISDTIVVDYGLPVRISVLGNDYYGGVLNAIAKDITAGTALDSNGHSSRKLINAGAEATLTYGTAKIDGEYIIYTPTTTNMNAEEVFYYEYKVGDTYYYTTVTVVPATSIYYEETFMEFVDGDGYEWEDVGTPITGKFQAEDRPGTFAFDIFDADNAYGEDEAYNDSFTYSLGAAKKTTVDNKSTGKEPSATFTFSGTGFDLFSVTNKDTGAILVSVKGVTDTSFNKSYFVNTYYGYTLDDNGNLTPSTDLEDNSVYQVPVITKRDLAYGTYTVTIKPLYSFAFDPNYANNYGDYSIFVDSVRIFNPAGTDDDVTDAHLKDGEYIPVYKKIRDVVLSAETFNESVVENLGLDFSGSVFLDGTDATNGSGSSLSTYKEQGPNNELYLGKNQAIAFMVSSEDMGALASLQLGMKVVSGGEKAQVVVMNTSEKSANSFEVSGSTEAFKKLNSAIIWDQEELEASGTYKTKYPIVIANVSDTVISLTSFKWAHTSQPIGAEPMFLDFSVNEDTPVMATMALRNVVMAAEGADENATYDPADVSIKWADQTFTEGKEATLTVETPFEVVKVTVDGVEITECTLDADGNKIWSHTFVLEKAGENAFDVVLYDYNGEASEPMKTETIYVEEAPTQNEEEDEDDPTTDDPTTDDPETDDPETDDPATDEPVTESWFVRAYKAVIGFFKKIITFIGGLFA